MSKLANAWLNEATGEIHSPKGRMVWPTLLEARANRKIPDSKPKFNVTLLLPKSANLDAIKTEIARAALEKHGKAWKDKKLRLPLVKTEDEPKLREYAEEFPFVLKAASNEEFPPFVFGPDAKKFSGSSSDSYSGRWAVISGGAWGYDTGSSGVGWNLWRVQLLDHDESIAGGRVETAEGFEAVAAIESAASAGGAKTTDDIFG